MKQEYFRDLDSCYCFKETEKADKEVAEEGKEEEAEANVGGTKGEKDWADKSEPLLYKYGGCCGERRG